MAGGGAREEDEVCDVCRDGSWTERNKIVFCEGVNCGVAVHQKCYGVSEIPAGDKPWFCAVCAEAAKSSDGTVAGKKQGDLACVICCGTGGAMKPLTRKNPSRWAHVACVMAVPETHFRFTERLEEVHGYGSHSLPARRALLCVYCGSKFGVCLRCAIRGCNTSYHVRCGQTAGIRFDLKPTLSEKLTFCSAHVHLAGAEDLIDAERRKTAGVPNVKGSTAAARRGQGSSGNDAARAGPGGLAAAGATTWEDSTNDTHVKASLPFKSYTSSDFWREVEPRFSDVRHAQAFKALVGADGRDAKKEGPADAILRRSLMGGDDTGAPQHKGDEDASEDAELTDRLTKTSSTGSGESVSHPSTASLADEGADGAAQQHIRSSKRQRARASRDLGRSKRGRRTVSEGQLADVSEGECKLRFSLRHPPSPAASCEEGDANGDGHDQRSACLRFKLRTAAEEVALVDSHCHPPSDAQTTLPPRLRCAAPVGMECTGLAESDVQPTTQIETDLRFMRHRLKTQRRTNDAMVSRLRVRVQSAPAEKIESPFTGDDELESRCKKMFGRCMLCGKMGCKHKLLAQKRDFKNRHRRKPQAAVPAAKIETSGPAGGFASSAAPVSPAISFPSAAVLPGGEVLSTPNVVFSATGEESDAKPRGVNTTRLQPTFSSGNFTFPVLNSSSLQSERLAWMRRAQQKSAWLKAEVTALNSIALEEQGPKALDDNDARKQVLLSRSSEPRVDDDISATVDYLLMKVVHRDKVRKRAEAKALKRLSTKHGRELAMKAKRRRQRELAKLERSSKSPNVGSAAGQVALSSGSAAISDTWSSADQRNPPIGEGLDAFVMRVKRTGTDTFAFLSATPQPFHRERLTIRVNGARYSIA